MVDGCDKPVHAVGMCSSHRRAWNRQKNAHLIQCEQCGRDVVALLRAQRFCSHACSAANASVVRLAAQAALRRQVVLYTGRPKFRVPVVPASRTFTAGCCRVCGAGFVALRAGLTCSYDCRLAHRAEIRRAANGRRRALERDAFVANVSPMKVFEMDGYRCHLCSKKVDMRVVVPHPRAATVDHVIPLALGGTHEPVNCRTACFGCNSLKSHRGSGDQMLLFA